MCFDLSGDLREKKGQIAHLDQNASNSSEDNLVFLCLEHHDQFDSSTSQSKGLTKEEVKIYRKHLYLAIETGLNSNSTNDELREKDLIIHDREIFNRANQILPESHLITFLDILQTDDLYTQKGAEPVRNFCLYFTEIGNYYLLPQLESPIKELINSLEKLLDFLALNFFVHPRHRLTEDNCSFALYPDLNVDRGGNGSIEQMIKYDKFRDKLDELCRDARKNYKNYRLTVKRTLLC